MILHCVFCNFRDDVSQEQRHAILEELSAFSCGLSGVTGFDFGPNRDFENLSQAFSHGFVIRFKDANALQAYSVHPVHRKLGSRLRDLCISNGIMVFDLEVE